MFQRLTDFGYQRTAVEAFGFYLAYLVLGILLAAVLGLLAGRVSSSFGFEGGLIIGAALAIIACPLLSFAILRAKGLLHRVGYLAVIVLSVAGAAAGGLFLGLIFVAFLSTRPAITSAETVQTSVTY